MSYSSGTVRQSGYITPGHAVKWVADGVVADAGPASNGSVTGYGVQSSGIGFNQNSGPLTGTYTSLGWGFVNGVPTINVSGNSGATELNFDINGTIYQISNLVPPPLPFLTSLVVTPEQYGAKGDGVTDDSAAFNAALSSGGCVILALNREHRYYLGINGSISVPADCTILGVDRGGIVPAGTSFTEIPGCLILGTNTTITLGGGSGNGRARISNVAIVQTNASTPALTLAQAVALPGQFTGTAVTVNGEDCVVDNCGIFGFTQAVSSTGFGRVFLYRISFDCINGLLISGGGDRGYMIQCEGWPFMTAQAQTALSADRASFMARNGNAFSFVGSCDWAQAANCFAYGYTNSYNFSNCGGQKLTACAADNLGYVATGTLPNGQTYNLGNPNAPIAYNVTGSCSGIELLFPNTVNHNHGVVNATTATEYGDGIVTVVGGSIVSQGDCILNSGTGSTTATGTFLQSPGYSTAPVASTSYGVKATSGAVNITGLIMYGCYSGPFYFDPSIFPGNITKFGNVLFGMTDTYPDYNQNSVSAGPPGGQGRLAAVDRRSVASGNGGEVAVAVTAAAGTGGDPSTGILWGARGSVTNATSGSEQSNLIFRTYYEGAFKDMFQMGPDGSLNPITANTQMLGEYNSAWNEVWQNAAGFVSISSGATPTATGIAGTGVIQIDAYNGVLWLATQSHVYKVVLTMVS